MQKQQRYHGARDVVLADSVEVAQALDEVVFGERAFCVALRVSRILQQACVKLFE